MEGDPTDPSSSNYDPFAASSSDYLSYPGLANAGTGTGVNPTTAAVATPVSPAASSTNWFSSALSALPSLATQGLTAYTAVNKAIQGVSPAPAAAATPAATATTSALMANLTKYAPFLIGGLVLAVLGFVFLGHRSRRN